MKTHQLQILLVILYFSNHVLAIFYSDSAEYEGGSEDGLVSLRDVPRIGRKRSVIAPIHQSRETPRYLLHYSVEGDSSSPNKKSRTFSKDALVGNSNVPMPSLITRFEYSKLNAPKQNSFSKSVGSNDVIPKSQITYHLSPLLRYILRNGKKIDSMIKLTNPNFD